MFLYGAGMAAIYTVVWGVKLGRERVAVAVQGKREVCGRTLDMESGGVTQLSSGETSKAHSLSDKRPQVGVHAI